MDIITLRITSNALQWVNQASTLVISCSRNINKDGLKRST